MLHAPCRAAGADSRARKKQNVERRSATEERQCHRTAQFDVDQPDRDESGQQNHSPCGKRAARCFVPPPGGGTPADAAEDGGRAEQPPSGSRFRRRGEIENAGHRQHGDPPEPESPEKRPELHGHAHCSHFAQRAIATRPERAISMMPKSRTSSMKLSRRSDFPAISTPISPRLTETIVPWKISTS